MPAGRRSTSPKAAASSSHAVRRSSSCAQGTLHLAPDGQQHWHGADHEHFMTHISITHGPATWGDHVTDAEYGEDRR